MSFLMLEQDLLAALILLGDKSLDLTVYYTIDKTYEKKPSCDLLPYILI